MPIAPGPLRDALAATAALRRDDPALAKWILQGHPNLTEREHVERFGGPYTVTRKKGR